LTLNYGILYNAEVSVDCVASTTSLASVHGVSEYNVIMIPTKTSSNQPIYDTMVVPFDAAVWNPAGKKCGTNKVGIYQFGSQY
jgi:hypothetical protein